MNHPLENFDTLWEVTKVSDIRPIWASCPSKRCTPDMALFAEKVKVDVLVTAKKF